MLCKFPENRLDLEITEALVGDVVKTGHGLERKDVSFQDLDSLGLINVPQLVWAL